MILTDYLRSEHDLSWDFAKQCGVEYGTIRLPEDPGFDITDRSHWKDVIGRFTDFGIKPIIVEPLPNNLHDHIKTGDRLCDESIEKFIKALPIMAEYGIQTVCFNFMANIGWLRTSKDIPERGGALVTGFRMEDFSAEDSLSITEDQLWTNYEYFVRSVVPEAERCGVKLALHPDDPPVNKLGDVSRIMVSFENIKRAVETVRSDSLGITLCQACYRLMGEDLEAVTKYFRDKIFFIHFRNVAGNKFDFHETFHDNGAIDMAEALRIYKKYGVDVPIRVDHVPLLAGEQQGTAGYTNLGRLYAIGYLKGLLEAIDE